MINKINVEKHTTRTLHHQRRKCITLIGGPFRRPWTIASREDSAAFVAREMPPQWKECQVYGTKIFQENRGK